VRESPTLDSPTRSQTRALDAIRETHSQSRAVARQLDGGSVLEGRRQ
jgi:hypothetical protein